MIKKIFQSKKNIIILIIVVVVIIEIFLLIFSKPKSDITNTPISQNQITPIPNSTTNQIQNSNITSPSLSTTPSKETISPKPTEEIFDLDYRRPLSRLLPYKGTYFKSNRYVGTNKLEILIKNKTDTELAKKEAQDWLVENGVDQDDEIIVSYRY